VQVIQRKLIASTAVVAAELDQEAVLLNVETGLYFGLDAVGAEVWKLLEQGATEHEIMEHLLAEFDVEPSQLRADMREFLDQLLSHGLILSENA
jgi:hypothetical protein